MIKLRYKLEYVHFDKECTDLGESIMTIIEDQEKKGWEHYDTIISPTFSEDRMAFLYFKKKIKKENIKRRMRIAT